MVTRRAELPSLNQNIERTATLVGAGDIHDTFNPPVEHVFTRTARARRIDLQVQDQFAVTQVGISTAQVRRYLVRPDRETVDLAAEGETPDTRYLTWAVGDTFTTLEGRTGEATWRVVGVGDYDSAGRMLELLVEGTVL